MGTIAGVGHDERRRGPVSTIGELIDRPEPSDVDTRRHDQLPFRLRLGVTGHLELTDVETLKVAVASVLDEILERFSDHRTEVVYRVVSPLAEGADRLVARAVLKRPEADLVVLLPFPRARYLQDFGTPESKLEFEELLREAVSERVIADERDLSDEEHYERVGQDVVDHADVLIALWNGQPAKGIGGTASVVSYARGQSADAEFTGAGTATPARSRRRGSRNPAARRIPVFVVRTDRHGELSRCFDDCDWAELTSAYRHLDYFNHFRPPARRLRRSVQAQRGELRAPMDRLLPFAGDPSESARLEQVTAALEGWIVSPFSIADTGANSFRRQVLRVGVGTAVFAALAVIVAAARVVLWPKASVLTWVEVALMAAILAGRLTLLRRRAHTRWLSFRALAEWLRVMPYLALSGESSSAVSGLAGPSDSDVVRPPIVQLEWYRRAVEEIWRGRPALDLHEFDFAWLRALVVRGWIGSQIAYHRRRGHQHWLWHRVLRIGVLAAFGGTLVSAVLHLLGGGAVTEFLAIALPAIGGALSYIEVHQEHGRHAERYRWTLSRLAELMRRGEIAGEVRDLQTVIRHTLDLMNTENSDWADVMWEHDPELSA